MPIHADATEQQTEQLQRRLQLHPIEAAKAALKLAAEHIQAATVYDTEPAETLCTSLQARSLIVALGSCLRAQDVLQEAFPPDAPEAA